MTHEAANRSVCEAEPCAYLRKHDTTFLMMTWTFQTLDQMSAAELLRILKLRSEVFVVEQQCIYNDPDEFDDLAIHVSANDAHGLVAYARVLPAGTRFEHVSIGRVVIAPRARRQGHGIMLMKQCMDYAWKCFGSVSIQLSAQVYLLDFYRNLGFREVSEQYDEDGIPHVEMMCDPLLRT